MATRTILPIAGVLAVAATLGIIILVGDSGDLDSGLSTSAPGDGLLANSQIGDDETGDDRTFISTEAFADDWDETADEGDGRRAILVLDKAGQPVKGARVEIFTQDERERFRRRFGMGLEEEEEPAASATSDGQGFARFKRRPPASREVRIKATKEDLIGFTRMGRNSEPPEDHPDALAVVTLERRRRLDIVVRDSAGLPAGDIQVQVRAVGEDAGGRRRGMRGRGFGSLNRWTSSKEGTVSIDISAKNETLFSADNYEITATLYGADPVREKVPVASGSVTKAEVVIPVSVTIDVALKKSSGEVHKPKIRLQWNVTMPDAAEAGDRRERMMRFFMRSGRRDVTGGRTRIGGFRTGSKVVFEPTSNERVQEKTEALLPTSPGTIETVVMVGDLLPYVTATLVEPDGKPAVRQRLIATVRADTDEEETGDFVERMMTRMRSGGQGATDLRTKRDGSIRIPVRPDVSGTIELTERDRGGRGFGGRRGGRGRGRGGEADREPLAILHFNALSAGEQADLGTVELDRGAILVGGRIVNKKGKGQERMRVQVRGTPPPATPGAGQRERPQFLRATTDEKGKFAVHAEARENYTYSVSAVARGVAISERPFEPGTDNLELVVTQTGAIKGKVKSAHPELSLRLDISMRKQRGPGENRGQTLRARPSADGSFTVSNLLAGIYDFEVRANGLMTFELNGLEVPEGETIQPPELVDLLVGHEFLEAIVMVQDEAGAPISGARITVEYKDEGQARRPGGRGGRRGGWGGGRTGKDGIAKQVIRGGGAGMRLSVRASNFKSATVDDPVFPLTVTLERTLSLTIKLKPPLAQREGMGSYRLALATPGGSTPESSNDPRRLRRFMESRGRSRAVRAGQETVTFRNIEAGRYSVTLTAVTSSESPLGRRRATLSVGEIELLRGSNAPFIIVIDPGAIDNALSQAPVIESRPRQRGNRGTRNRDGENRRNRNGGNRRNRDSGR